MNDLKNIIRDIPDFPKKGIIFKDITTLLQDAQSYQKMMTLSPIVMSANGSTRLSVLKHGVSSSVPRWHINCVPVSYWFASQASFHPKPSAKPTTWNTGPTLLKSTKMPSSRVSGSL